MRPTRKPLDLAKDAHVKALAKRLDELHGATAQAAARGMPRSDGLDEATLQLYARLAQLLDADPIGKIEALRMEQRQAAAEAKAALAARLAELEKEIETAVEAEDYERADELNTAADGLRAELDAL